MFDAVFVDSTETNTHAIEHLLKLAQENPSGTFPQGVSDSYIQGARIEYYLPSDPKCWTFLQETLAQNSNHYSITAHDSGRKFRDVDDSVVQVDFADGRSVGMVFYQGALVACNTANKTN